MSEIRPLNLSRRAGLLLAIACVFGGGCSKYWASVDAVKTHALAFGAILDSQNGDPHSRLAPPMGPDERQKSETRERELLASYWNIHNRGELLDTLDGLQSGSAGHRHAYWDIRRRLLEGRMENYLPVITGLSSANNGGARAFIVATHLGPLRGATLPITAWDFGRYINLCRWGVLCGWITEAEAWDRILPAARLLQASYASWDDYAADYLLGRNFWSPESASENETIRYTVALLKLAPNGLWSTVPWNETLGSGEAMRDTLAVKLLDHYVDPDPNGVSLDHMPDSNPMLIMVRTSVDAK
jgi:hypothetical protein